MRLIPGALAQQRLTEQSTAYQLTGRPDIARELERSAEQRQHLAARQDISDAVDAVRAGDQTSAAAAMTTAIARQINGAQLRPRRKIR